MNERTVVNLATCFFALFFLPSISSASPSPADSVHSARRSIMSTGGSITPPCGKAAGESERGRAAYGADDLLPAQ